MTRKEAIFILANIDRRVCDDELSEALDMAIEALKQLKEKPEYIDTQHVGMVLRDVPEQPEKCPMHQKKTYIDADMLKEIKGIFNKPNVATILPDETYITCKQESCDDCISRVLEYIEASNAELGHSSENELVCQDIKELLPVTPQKTGRWIDIMVGDMPAQACDQCNTFYPLAYTGGGHKYCPNCGAKMESEE